jgi:predicted DNA-binding transcriptional regulator YafY
VRCHLQGDSREQGIDDSCVSVFPTGLGRCAITVGPVKRSDRHRALVDLLRARAEQPISVPRLADRFEVSTRTIERDIRALQEAGVPIYGVPGCTGGFAIGRDFSLPPLAITPAEALAVLAGLGVMDGSPLARDAVRVRDKVLAAMSPQQRAQGRAFAARVALMAPDRPTEDEVARVVREVLVEPRVVELAYCDPRTGACTERSVEPLGMILVRGNWILVGWCRLRGGVRGFRTDGITAIRHTSERPPVRDPDPLVSDLSRWDFLAAAP